MYSKQTQSRLYSYIIVAKQEQGFPKGNVMSYSCFCKLSSHMTKLFINNNMTVFKTKKSHQSTQYTGLVH